MASPKLSPNAVALIEQAVEKIFLRAKARFSGKIPYGTPKGLVLSLQPQNSIGALFKLAAKTEGTQPNEELLHSVVKIGLNYLDATKEKAKAKMIHSVQAFITDAHNQGVETDVETVLGGKISELWGEVTSDVKRIVETESTVATNMSIADSITKINLASGIKDPVVAFLCVHDNSLCQECKRLHLLKDGITPRVWKMSECGSAYHKKGDSSPKIGGLHPNERCVMITVLPGYTFDSAGKITYKEPGWDEWSYQRGV